MHRPEDDSRYKKVCKAIADNDMDAVKDLLRTFDHSEKQDMSRVLQKVLFWALRERPFKGDILEFLWKEDWHAHRNCWLNRAIRWSNTHIVDMLCRLGGGPVGPHCFDPLIFASICWPNKYAVLAAHNLLSPKIYFCCQEDDSLSVVAKQMALAFLFDLSRDSCCRIGSWDEDEIIVKEDGTKVRDMVELFVEHGASFEIGKELQRQLPRAGPHLREILRTALQPPSLMSLCRKSVKRVTPKTCYRRWVEKLGLPGPLAQYMCPSPTSSDT